MTKDEVMQQLQQGKKVTHESFGIGHWIQVHRNSNFYLDESKNLINIERFWRYRPDIKFLIGWTLYKRVRIPA